MPFRLAHKIQVGVIIQVLNSQISNRFSSNVDTVGGEADEAILNRELFDSSLVFQCPHTR